MLLFRIYFFLCDSVLIMGRTLGLIWNLQESHLYVRNPQSIGQYDSNMTATCFEATHIQMTFDWLKVVTDTHCWLPQVPNQADTLTVRCQQAVIRCNTISSQYRK